jgi:hypothetical protein
MTNVTQPSLATSSDILQCCRCLGQRDHGRYHRKTGNNDIGEGKPRPGDRNSKGDSGVHQLWATSDGSAAVICLVCTSRD